MPVIAFTFFLLGAFAFGIYAGMLWASYEGDAGKISTKTLTRWMENTRWREQQPKVSTLSN